MKGVCTLRFQYRLSTLFVIFGLASILFGVLHKRQAVVNELHRDLRLQDTTFDVLDHDKSRALLIIRDPRFFKLIIAHRSLHDKRWRIARALSNGVDGAFTPNTEYTRSFQAFPDDASILKFRQDFGFESE
jgi:hypothetical protein